MPALEIDAALMRALRKRARKENTTAARLMKRLIAEALQECDDYEAVKAFRARSGRTVPLTAVKRRLT
jgi:hypothetical protein